MMVNMSNITNTVTHMCCFFVTRGESPQTPLKIEHEVISFFVCSLCLLVPVMYMHIKQGSGIRSQVVTRDACGDVC